MLREQAARQFSVPVGEIVVGSVDIEGGEVIVSAPEYSTTGLMTVEVPTGGRGPSSWRASATVWRRAPKPE
jgi:hypothetical protein